MITKRKKHVILGGLLITIGLIIGLVISANLNIFNTGYTTETRVSKDAVDLLSRINNATAEVAAAAMPSVVNIASTTTVHSRGMDMPFMNDPFFRDFFGDRFRSFNHPRDYKQRGMGSGVIVDANGYILTNNHVIAGAEEIKVTLADKREFKGKVIGSDAKTDLAVVQIESDHLPVLTLGDSDKLKVGERVIAIGTPFGLNQTVTSGIISAKGRADVGIAEYEDFIQTDTPINPGNSGGALVNVRGELIGINTAILSASGGSQGVGFAIPSNMAKVVMTQLIKKGKVSRGWLGVSIQEITPELAKKLNLKDAKGVLVTDVTEGGPAAKAGIQSGDTIVMFDEKEVADPSSLKNMVGNTVSGKQVSVKYVRSGSLATVKVTIQTFPEDQKKLASSLDNQLKGVAVQNITPDVRKSLNLPPRVTGVVVIDIMEGTPAADILTPGDIVMEINRKKIMNVGEYEAVVASLRASQNILLLIYRNGAGLFVTL
ncbi:MAG TPA: DegQ family serine endoprotease [Syntrophales bacterium]|nr:DegQ family serine endoprotease [Syntrophales bacterium]